MYKNLLSSFAFAMLSIALPVSAQTTITDPAGINQALGMSGTGANAAAVAKPIAVVPVAAADANSLPPDLRAQTPQFYDYTANLNSDVFGANLFTGAFARQGVTQFNPDYALTVGDKIQVRLWGAFEYDAQLTVDPKGNILLPHAGPVQVLGARNQDLQRLVEAAIAKVFRSNVYSYASLAAAQPVRVFVSGFVNRPGLYSGSSMDSLLHFLDQAGGIDPERGSFLTVQVKRGTQVRGTANLYEFLLDGTMPSIQLADGDVIFVTARQNTVKVTGLAANAKRFEYTGTGRTVADVVAMAKPKAGATHVRVVRNTGTIKNVEYVALADAGNIQLQNGDELEFTADKKLGTITVRVEGEHQSVQEYVLPYGTRMGDLLAKIEYSERSDAENLQLFRLSVKERQRVLLQSSLRSLEVAALTARSGTSDEARLRKEESELLLQWVERARKVETSGQVLIAQSASRDALLLENGDVIRVPAKDGLVLVSGEVLFPNAIPFDKNMSVSEYISKAGGYTQNAESSRVVIAHRDGSFGVPGTSSKSIFNFGRERSEVRAGDEILVLPKIDVKNRQIWKDMTQIIYQIAVSAKVVLGL